MIGKLIHKFGRLGVRLWGRNNEGDRVGGLGESPADFNPMAIDQHLTVAAEQSSPPEGARYAGEIQAGLTRIAHIALSTLDLDELIHRTMGETTKLLAAEKGALLLWDEKQEELVVHPAGIVGATTEEMAKLCIKAGDSAFGMSISRQGRPFIFNDASCDQHISQVYHPLVQRFNVKTWLAVPVTLQEQNIGELHVVNKTAPFTREDARALTTVAAYMAAAIQKARLLSLADQRLRKRVEELSGLQRVSRELNSTLDQERILRLVLQEATRATRADSGNMSLYDRGTGQILAWTDFGFDDEERDCLKESKFHTGVGMIGRALWTGEPVLAPDVSLDPGYAMISSKSRSGVAVPVSYAGDVAGVINLESRRPNAFNEGQLRYLETLANQAAVAIRNSLAFEEQRRQRELLRQRANQLARLSEVSHAFRSDQPLESVLEDIAYAIQETLGFNIVLISVMGGDPPVLRWVAGAGIPLTEMERLKARPQSPEVVIDLMQDRFRLGAQSYYIPHSYKEIWEGRFDVHRPEPEHLPPVTGERRWNFNDLCLSPLYNLEHQLIGVLCVDAPRNGQVPDRELMETVEIFANQAAAAIENAQLFGQVRQYADRLRVINEVGVEITSILNVEKLIARVSQLVEDNFGHQVHINLIEEEIIDWDAPSARPLEQSTAAPAATETSLSVLDVERKATYSEIVIPLKVQDRIIGLFEVRSEAPDAFTENEVMVLQSLAGQTAVAIANAQLFQQASRMGQELEQRVQERTEALAKTLDDLTLERDRVETLYRITRELSASLDLDRVLMEALNLINRAVGVSHGSIMLLEAGSDRLINRAALGRTRGLPRGGKPTRYRRGVGLAGWVVETREAIILPDVTKDPRWLPSKKEPKPDRRSAMAVPLISGEDVMGVLLLFHPEVDYFTQDHLRLVSAAAAQVTTAINNAELYQLITDQAERLGVMLRTQQAEAAKHQAIVEGIADGVLVLDANRHVVLMNPAAGQILGLDASAVEGQHIRDILARAETAVDQALARQLYDKLMTGMEHFGTVRSLQGSETTSLDFRLEAEDKVVVVNLSLVLLASGELPSLVTVLRDISHEAEVDRLKDEFISTVSHELRTPMTSIKGYADLLGNKKIGPLNEQQGRFVQVIRSNADRLTALVNDILDISRIETGRIKFEIKPLDMLELINRVTDSFQGQMVKKSLELKLDLPPTLPPVRGDEDRVTQILDNLISNAWKYTPEGGQVTIRARVLDGVLQVNVSDTGIGINEKDLGRIFDRFYRTEQAEVQAVDGTGLGLSIVKMFVELLGGDIWVESTVNQGSTFSFTLPVIPEVAGGPSDGDVTAPKILVVDDDEHILQLLRHQLETEGYRVLTAQRGEDVLPLARSEQPALITLDILLGDVDGFEVLETLKEDPMTASIPIIIVSVVTDAETRGLTLGAASYISKPFEEQQVVNKVQAVLSSLSANGSERFNRVLVVDDDRHIVDWLKEALTNSGFTVRGAYNGHEALTLAREDTPDLILLDLKMPDMDGYEVIHNLRREPATHSIPVIVITGSSLDDYDHVRVLGLGVEHMLTKPFTAETLVEEIKRIGHRVVG